MAIIKRSKGNKPGTPGPKIRRVHLVSGKTAKVQEQLRKKAIKETTVFEKLLTLTEAIARVEAAGLTEAQLRTALDAGDITYTKSANNIRYEISPASLDAWIATQT